MNHKLRPFTARAVQHIYQKSIDGGVVFYNVVDRIVFCSVVCVMAERYGITILMSAIMFTHLHHSLIANMKSKMSKFMQDATSVYARLHNCHYGRKGSLFHDTFGSAAKTSEKKIRENLAYVANNHVEKGLCKHAVDERWTFLPYYRNGFPFSEPITLEKASQQLTYAMRFVARRRKQKKYLKYSDWYSITIGLNHVEIEQLIDYTISTYLYVDFDKAIEFYGDFETMVSAFDSVVGAEHDIKEEYYRFSDQEYVRIGKILKEKGWSPRKIYEASRDEKVKMANVLMNRYQIDGLALRKYMHL
ncbi:MAG: transposase [Bacteroidales bacterium]|nr:transposase [Bacteroidales bacterium]